jgi:acyl-CoA thioester hydrolase
MSEHPDSFDIPVRVRYAECDSFGLLHHARYFEYFEMARTELLRSRGIRYRDLEAQGVFFVVTRIECRYRAPVRYDDLVTIRTRVVRKTRTRVDHTYEMHVDGRLVTEAASTLACVGRDGRPALMPEAMWSAT